MAVLDDLASARPDTIDGACGACENPAVEHGIPATPGKRGMRGVQRHDISACAGLKADHRLRERLGADGEPSACIKEFAGRKDAVAEACFGDRAESGDGAASGK